MISIRTSSYCCLLAALTVMCSAAFPIATFATPREEIAAISTTAQEQLSYEVQDLPSQAETIEAQLLDGVGARAAALLLSDQTGGEFDGAVTWTSNGSTRDEGLISIQVFVEVSGRDLLKDTAGFPIPIDVYAYIIDDEGALTAHLSQELILENQVQVQGTLETGLKFVFDFDIPLESQSFRVLVLNPQTNRIFLGGCYLGIPAGDPTPPFLLPPLVSESVGNWTIGIQNGVRPKALLDGLPDMTMWPSAMPTWRLGENLEVVLGGSELFEFAEVAAHLLDRHGQTIFDCAIEIGPLLTTRNSLSFYHATIITPEVPVGEYRLEVFTTDSTNHQIVAQSLPILIHDQESAVAWTDPAAPRTSASHPLSLQRDPPTPAEAPPEAQDEPPTATQTPDPVTNIFDCQNDDRSPSSEPIEVISLGGVGARGAALLLSSQSGGDVDGAIIWTSSGREDDGTQVSIQFMVEVDGRSLLAASPHPRIPIEVYGYLLDDNGTVVGHISDGILLEECSQGLEIYRSGIKFVGQLRTPPGLYSLRIVVRNRLTQKFTLFRRDLDLRFDDQIDLFLLPPLVEEPVDSWIMAGEHGLDLDSVQDNIKSIRSWPSAMPTWKTDEALEMILGCSKLVEGRHISAQLIDRFGNSVLDPDVEVDQSISTAGDLSFYRISVAAPDVPAGEYRFALNLTDTNSGQTVSQSLPVLLHERDSRFVWTDPAAPRTASSLGSSAPIVSHTPVNLEIEAMRAVYTDALRLWSNGETVAARRKLAEIEHPLESTASARNWRQLITVERLVALNLAENQPASWMAVAMFHRDMYSWYLARREPQLARHSWQMASMMARMAPPIDGNEALDRFSEYILLDLASRLVRSGQRRPARQLLEAAHKIAPESAPALLGLGALYERSGFPQEAADELKTLFKKHPNNYEGRLRLAINRRRIGEKKAAEEIFRGLLRPSSPLWIRTLAYQELGRLLIDEGRIEEAEAQLRDGVMSIPGNQRLKILLSHTLDQSHRPKEAESVVALIETRGSQQSTSPRYRYSRWPDLDVERVRSTLAAANTVGLEALRKALP